MRRVVWRATTVIALGSLLGAGARLDAQPGPRCPYGLPPFASPFCAELVPVPDLSGVRGMLELQWIRTPFGVAVRPDGQLRHRLVAHFEALPPPSAVGGARAYVAWGYDIAMGREHKLAVVREGTTTLGELPYEYFRVLVTAEIDPAVRTRRGRLVARATSPSALMLSHRDAMAPMIAAPASADPHAGHGTAWPMPPGDKRLQPTFMAHAPPSTAPWLPTVDTTGIPSGRPRQLVTLRNGDTLRLVATPIRRTLGGRTVVMYGYNGQYPGPLIHVAQNTAVVVQFTNALELPSTVHWHGLRHDYRDDGVPHISQEPVAPGDSFTYRLRFPDAGIYWYHPHVREDIQQELGLYGNILVATQRTRARAPVHREEVLAIDDVLMTEQGVMPFGQDTATHALMGRFGNVGLVNGEPRYTLTARAGDVVRFYLTNVANSRIFNLRIPGARMKLVAGDMSYFEQERFVESVVIAPAERYVVEVHFERPGNYALLNSVRWLDHMRGAATPVTDTLGVVTVAPGRPRAPNYARRFATQARHADVEREVNDVLRRAAAQNAPDHTLTLTLRLRGISPSTIAMLSGMAVPIDWNDGMPMMNWPMTAREVAWIMRDERGRENMEIAWRFRAGTLARIRIVNDPASVHAMAHPLHFHGQRFLIVSRNGIATANRVWKDTALLPAGETMDIVLDLSNHGRWMMHCHIAEHLGAGMMGLFVVDGDGAPSPRRDP